MFESNIETATPRTPTPNLHILEKLKFHHRKLTRRLHGLICQGCLFHFISLRFFLFFQYMFCQTPRQAFVISWWSERKSCSHVAHCLWGRQTDKQSATKQCGKCSLIGACRVYGAARKEVLTCSEASGDGNCLEKHSEKDFREPLAVFQTYEGNKTRNIRNVESLHGWCMKIILKLCPQYRWPR